jgi:hypothetical protein
MSDNQEPPNLKNFLPSNATPPDETEYKSVTSMLVKDEVNRKLDLILSHIYRFSNDYCITPEQSFEFIRKRYYQQHYQELSTQFTLDCYLEPLQQRDLDGKQVLIYHTKDHRIIIKKEED